MNIIVLGLGAMGTATAMHLARRISRRAYFTGFASLDGATIKLTLHAPGARSSPRDVSRLLSDEDARKPEAFVERWLKGVEPRAVRGKTCMYTMTPEEHFIVDRHPSHANVHFGAGFSGHGFKFAPVVGECLAGLSLAASHDTRSNFSASTSGRWARCRRRPSPRRWSCATRARSRRTLRKPRAASAFGSAGNRPPRHQRLRLRVERGARGHRSETCRQSQQHAFHATNTPDRPIDAAKTAGFAR